MLVDLRPKKLTGKDAEEVLGKAGITVNKNMIPFDPEKPMVTLGRAHRHAGDDHPRHEGGGDGHRGRAHRRGAGPAADDAAARAGARRR